MPPCGGGKFYINPHRDRARHIGSRFRPPVRLRSDTVSETDRAICEILFRL